MLTADEGGRSTPFTAEYRPQFFLRTTDVSGSLDLGEATVVLPGDDVDVRVTLDRPVAIEVGMGVAVREGGRTVAGGVVTAVPDAR